MKQNPLLNLTLLLTISLLSTLACQKEAGVGGDATIRGVVQAQKWNSTFTQQIGEYPARDADVFIIYGDRTYGYDDRTHTDYNGRFEFPYLYEGAYQIYVYSRDSSAAADVSGVSAVVQNISITGRQQVVETDTLVIFE